MLRTEILAVGLACAFASSAFAADLPSRKFAPAAPVAPVFTWTGFYVGANAGAAWSNSSTRLTPFDPTWFTLIDTRGSWHKSQDDVSFSGGAQVGYNYQIGSVVLGAEADFNYANLKTGINGRYNETAGGFTADNNFTTRSKVEWFGTVRARLGFTPHERLMIYGTGGLAYGSVKATAVETFNGTFNGVNVFSDVSNGSKSDNRFGWTLGGGAEYALTNNLSLKAEYLYVDLGKQSFSTVSALGAPEVRVEHDTKFSVLRAGVNYRF